METAIASNLIKALGERRKLGTEETYFIHVSFLSQELAELVVIKLEIVFSDCCFLRGEWLAIWGDR